MPRTTQLARKAAKPAARKAAPAPVPAKKAKAPKAAPVPEPEDDDEDDDEELLLAERDSDNEQSASDSDSDSDDDDDGVSPEGLEALMRALGDDGLDEEDQARLALLREELEAGAGASGSDEEAEQEDEEEEEDEDGEMEGEELESEEEEDAEAEETELPAPLVQPPKSKIKGDTLAASLARSGLIPEPQSDLEEEEDEEEEASDEDAEEDDEEDADENGAGPASGKKRHPRPSELRPKINNVDAMLRIRAELALDGGSAGSKGKNYLPWIEHMATTYGRSIQEEMGDEPGAADDDLKRELAL
jgi:rRNA-processing protein EBP2